MQINRIELPEVCLVLLMGASGAGKTTFARKHFSAGEILSSDRFRELVSGDENDMSASADAFELLHETADRRLKRMRLTVIDATNAQKRDRAALIDIAKQNDLHAAVIVLDPPEKIVMERRESRTDRGSGGVPVSAVRRQLSGVRQSVSKLRGEGFRFVHHLTTQEEIDSAEIVRTKMWNDKREEHGPFDIIGDIHGCYAELRELLCRLGYKDDPDGIPVHPDGRKAVFIGDLCDRGPENVKVLRLVMAMVRSGNALAVPGNHDVKLVKYLRRRNVQVKHGLEITAAELDRETEEFRAETADFLDSLVSHYVLDGGQLVVAHAGIKAEYIGRASSRVRKFCLYGDITGETDSDGFPVRLDWAADYSGKALVVYGHTPYEEVYRAGNTCCIDTGCVFGGSLTALRYPENETVSVPAHSKYAEPGKPMAKPSAPDSDTLAAEYFTGELHIDTQLTPGIRIRENNSAAAFEIMSRFAADPRWLIYLPPTMSPCETSGLPDYLEHPYEAFDYYKRNGVERVVCEKKHMGSRAVIVCCRSAESAAERFGVDDGSAGIIYTRTGRRFFDDRDTEAVLLGRLRTALEKSGFWDSFSTDWVCLDTELLPWSVKAEGLIREHYAPVGHAGVHSLSAAERLLHQTAARDDIADPDGSGGHDADISVLLERTSFRRRAMEDYVKAYSSYCGRVGSPEDIRIAPFHLLACEGAVFTDKPHVWHMETLRRYITDWDVIFTATPYITVNVNDPEEVGIAVQWWTELTQSGGEGMVVKPEDYIARSGGRLIQPAVKCRGREYLRIIYGPEYLAPYGLGRLKKRSLSRKRELALKELSLGIEALSRFVGHESLTRVHECVFGVLAMESEPVDPRL
ncbi:MAG: polynucleotide kinase-phosphatase [Ruminococcus sp.]|nr:polynucleotide kinase-phosphatase [Ruminococcus sp.]